MIACWINLIGALEAKSIKSIVEDLKKLKVDYALPIFCEGSGALYPSSVRPVSSRAPPISTLKQLVSELKKNGIEVHPWIVSLCFHHADYAKSHKDLYVVNRFGWSCVDNPPYVKHYLWLCPSREENRENLAKLAVEIAEVFDADGVHLDYIRLPDIILPIYFRRRYGLPLDEERRPRFDHCYCAHCRSKFERERGVDPMQIDYYDPLYEEWFKWRTLQVTQVVEHVKRKLKEYDSSLKLSAAVFPTPRIAYRYVFQNWPTWNLDFYCPMIYHKYYDKPIEWIGEAVEECLEYANNILAGLHAHMLQNSEEVHRAVSEAFERGAGICYFCYPFPRGDQQVEEFAEAVAKYRK